MSTSKWSGVVGARQVLPFPGDPGPGGRHAGSTEPRPSGGSRASGKHSGGRPEATRRRPAHTARRLVAALLAVLAAAWLLAAPVGTAPVATNHGQADSADSNQSPGGRITGRQGATIPDDVAAQLGSADPEEAVRGLASLRSLAFSSGRLELLDQVNVQGSTASAADERIGGPLRESGHILAGFTSILSEVSVLPETNESRAVVAVTSAASSYEEQDRSGELVARGLAAPAQQLRLVLVPVEGKWRITEILPGP